MQMDYLCRRIKLLIFEHYFVYFQAATLKVKDALIADEDCAAYYLPTTSCKWIIDTYYMASYSIVKPV